MIYSTVTFVFLLLAWNTFKNSLLNLSANVVHGLIIGGRLQYEYMPPLYTTPAIGYIRRSLIALYSFVGIVAMTIGIITIRKKKKLREDFVLAIALAASGFELVSMQFLFKVSQEFLPRELMYMTIGSSLALPIVLASGMFKNRACGLKRITALTRKGTLFVFFVSLLFLGIMTTYAQESNVKLCESELAGAKFVAHSMNPNISILYAENFGVIFFFNPRLVRNAFLTSNNPLIHDAIDRSGEIKENSIIVFEQTGYLQEQRALSMDLADSKPNWNRFCDSATYVGYYVDP
jgi:hypothetical protein